MNETLGKLKGKRKVLPDIFKDRNSKKYRTFMTRLKADGVYNYLGFTGRLEFDFKNSNLYPVSDRFLPYWIETRRDIRELWIRNSPITAVRGLKLCYHLKRLFLCKNKLREIPVLENKPALTYLNLSWNEIQTIDGDQLEQCKNLKYLNLMMNPITTIKNIHKLKKLQELWLPYEVLLSKDIQDVEWPTDLGAIYFVSMPLLQLGPSSQAFFEDIPPIFSLDSFIPKIKFWEIPYGHCALIIYFKEDRCPPLVRKILRDRIYEKEKMNLCLEEDLELLRAWFADAKPCCKSCGAPLEFGYLYWNSEKCTPEWVCSCGCFTDYNYLFIWSNYTLSTLRIGSGD